MYVELSPLNGVFSSLFCILFVLKKFFCVLTLTVEIDFVKYFWRTRCVWLLSYCCDTLFHTLWWCTSTEKKDFSLFFLLIRLNLNTFRLWENYWGLGAEDLNVQDSLNSVCTLIDGNWKKKIRKFNSLVIMIGVVVLTWSLKIL